MLSDDFEDELGGGSCAPTPARFELQEDPSFWKDNSVKVVIRIRPLSSSEISLQGRKTCVRQDSSQSLTWTGHPESRFTFDLVADQHVTQEDMFKVAGVPMVENCIAGYNSCMFAYGQTGSGKTHTMLGDIENGTRRNNVNCGITPRVFEHLFSLIQKEKELKKDQKLRFTCKCSFLEIYNEQILDLLNPNSVNLHIREDVKKGVHVENLTEYEVSNAREAMQQLIEGAANRKVAATNMNRASSRSHSVFTFVIESKWESQGIIHHRFSRLNLVDLAGSERQKSSGAEGERLKEATNINKSLSTLGLVITNLIASNKKSHHVPYRDSKLTFLLQDSLGGNSKTTIIANISPSSCCAAETLSTLKFAQRAKYIRNNAIVNEDASGDVLSMRLQIQRLTKEVSRLQGLVNTDKVGIGSICESPSTFKWDQGYGMFTPLTVDKRATQRHGYDAALVGALRREQEKDAELKAAIAAKQIAEQLAAQRAEETKQLKMTLRFRGNKIKSLEQVASGKLSAEAHLLQEKEDLEKELELLRCQMNRNPEITKFAMENLQLKEELRRLQISVNEEERNMMQEQITALQDKLLEALDWKLMHENDPVNKGISLFGESAGAEENEFLRLQAIQNEREIESLRNKLKFNLDAKEKLERRVDELTAELELAKKHDGLADPQMEVKTWVETIASISQREAEAHETAISLSKENDELRKQLEVVIEDNKRLVELYAKTIATEDASDKKSGSPFRGNLVNNDLLGAQTVHTSDLLVNNSSDSELHLRLEEMHEENDKLMGLYEKAMLERDEFKRKIFEQSNPQTRQQMQSDDAEMCEAADPENLEAKNVHDSLLVASKEVLEHVWSKLDIIQDKLGPAQDAVKYFKALEIASRKVEDIFASYQLHYLDLQHEQEGVNDLKFALSEAEEKRNAFAGKYLLPATSCWNFDSMTKALAESKFNSQFEVINNKKEQLNYLQTHKKELKAKRMKAREYEAEVRNRIDGLKLKLHAYETQRKEQEKVLFPIDNLDTSAASLHKSMKVTDLLKSVEERSKLQWDLKKAREERAMVQKQLRSLNELDDIDCKIALLETEIDGCCVSMLEADIEKFVRDSALTEAWVGRAKDMEAFLVDYQDCVFQVNLKEEEIKACEESLKHRTRGLAEMHHKLDEATRDLAEFLRDGRGCFHEPTMPVGESVEAILEAIRNHLAEAKQILPLDS